MRLFLDKIDYAEAVVRGKIRRGIDRFAKKKADGFTSVEIILLLVVTVIIVLGLFYLYKTQISAALKKTSDNMDTLNNINAQSDGKAILGGAES